MLKGNPQLPRLTNNLGFCRQPCIDPDCARRLCQAVRSGIDSRGAL